MRVVAGVACWLGAVAVAHADPAPDASPQASDAPKVTVSGYLETYYAYNFNQPSNLTTAYRGFDNHTNSFTVENAVLDITGTLGDVSVRLALQDGHTPAAYYAAEPSYPAQAGTGASNADLWRLIQQALIGYRRDKLLLEAGIFLDPIGPEGLAIKDQWSWSRSDLFVALPFYHAGVRATYALSDELTAAAFVTNGWNDIVNVNPDPCVAGQLTYAVAKLSATATYFGGVEPPTGSPEGQPWRHMFDLSGTYQATGELAFAWQANTGFEDNPAGRASWYDGAAYAKYRPLAKLWLAARVDATHEHDAENAARTIPRLFFPADDVRSVTLTVAAPIERNLTVMLEYRHDHASAPMYFQDDVATGPAGLGIATATSQNTLTLGAVGWF
nr:outer membrane beta-barrel protein [Kofleriaceae bacterium]